MPLPGANLNLLYQAIIIMASSSLYPRSSTKILVLSPPPPPSSNGLKELLEVRFEFSFVQIGKTTIFFQQANHGAYSNPRT